MVEIEKLYASRNDMLISIFKKLLYYKLSQVTSYKYIQIWKKMKFIIRIGIFITHLRLENQVYSNIFYKVSICNFVKR